MGISCIKIHLLDIIKGHACTSVFLCLDECERVCGFTYLYVFVCTSACYCVRTRDIFISYVKFTVL